MINEVFNEDCLIGMQRIASKSIDMILCDLPYGTTACKWDVIIPFAPLWAQYERVIKDNGAIVLTASRPFTSILVCSNLKMFKCEWIWEKEQGTNFQNAKYHPLRSHESILVFCKNTAQYNPIKEYGHAALKPLRKRSRKKIAEFIGGESGCGVTEMKYGSIDGSRYPKTILRVNRGESGKHPTQKPVALFEYLIKTYTNEGETVLDNCMGSGTTAIACININRNYIGFEKEEKYYRIIKERIKRHTPQLKLIA